jgi:hypothetical protein
VLITVNVQNYSTKDDGRITNRKRCKNWALITEPCSAYSVGHNSVVSFLEILVLHSCQSYENSEIVTVTCRAQRSCSFNKNVKESKVSQSCCNLLSSPTSKTLVQILELVMQVGTTEADWN